jgi:hypothetical protein
MLSIKSIFIRNGHDLPAFSGPDGTQEMAGSRLMVDKFCSKSAGVSWPRLECGEI